MANYNPYIIPIYNWVVFHPLYNLTNRGEMITTRIFTSFTWICDRWMRMEKVPSKHILPFMVGFFMVIFIQWDLSPEKNKNNHKQKSQIQVGVSKNRGGPPKWMVKIMENPIKMDDLGVPLFLETPKYVVNPGGANSMSHPFEKKRLLIDLSGDVDGSTPFGGA